MTKLYNMFDANTFVYTGKYQTSLPDANMVLVPLPEYSIGSEYLVFNPSESIWMIRDVEVDGNFYKKVDGSFASRVKLKDQNLYTVIRPNFNDGDEVKFSDQTNSWIFTNQISPVKGPITIKNEKLAELKSFYEARQQGYINTYDKLIVLKFLYLVNGKIMIDSIRDLSSEARSRGTTTFSQIVAINKTNNSVGNYQLINLPFIVIDWLESEIGGIYNHNLGLYRRMSGKIERGETPNLESISYNQNFYTSIDEIAKTNFFLENLSKFVSMPVLDFDLVVNTLKSKIDDGSLPGYMGDYDDKYHIDHFNNYYSSLIPTRDAATGKFNILTSI